jgi:hypothetical protein
VVRADFRAHVLAYLPAQRLGNNPQRATRTGSRRKTIPNKRGGDQPPPGGFSERPKISGPLSAFIALLGGRSVGRSKAFLEGVWVTYCLEREEVDSLREA